MSDSRTEIAPNMKDRVHALLADKGDDLTFEQAKQVIGPTLKEDYFKKLKQRWRHERPSVHKTAKPNGQAKGGNDQKLGAGKEAVTALLDQHGTSLSYEQALPMLREKGVEIGAEWYRRLVHEYTAQHSEGNTLSAPPPAPKVPVQPTGPTEEETLANGAVPDTFTLNDITETRALMSRMGKAKLAKLIEAL